MTQTTILYARVSTPKQVEEGYSLDQQIECLRQYAAEHELEIVEEVRDGGYSGATLDRPGMDRIFAVFAGGVDVVLAQDADRITREPWHFGYLKAEFERYGTKLRALDDGDDETPEGEFFAGIRRGMSKMEREYTKRRTRRGKEKRSAPESCSDRGARPECGRPPRIDRVCARRSTRQSRTRLS
jgi:site-specific DNA recombinase